MSSGYLNGSDALKGRIMRRLRALYHSLRARAILTPKRLWVAPPQIYAIDSTIADEIRAGYFSFNGKSLRVRDGESIFFQAAPGPDWQRALLGFSWIRHLRVNDSALSQNFLNDFFNTTRFDRIDIANEPAVVACRLLAFLSQSPIILSGCDTKFYDAFMQALAREARFLWCMLNARQVYGSDRISCAIALLEFAACADTGAAIVQRAQQMLADELNRQISSDGAHISRNTQATLNLLLDLLPLRQVFAARGLPLGETISRAIDRMMPFLRMMQHGDGSVALFNGSGETALGQLASVLAYEDTRGVAPLNAPYAGYQRLEAHEALILIDAGAPPPIEFSAHAHAGCLSFEFSLGVERIVVNSGSPSAQQYNLRDLARETSAHSTLMLDDRSSARIDFAPNLIVGEKYIIDGPNIVTVERTKSDDHISIALTHDGYVSEFGLIHSRALMLKKDATLFAGRDRLILTNNELIRRKSDFVIRFIFHPRVTLTLSPHGVDILLANGQKLLFETIGAALEIKESVFLASPAGARRCQQILLKGAATEKTDVSWSFQLLEP
ncbi:MAG: heparinase II/III family protein [Methylocystis sp.]